MEVMGKKHTGMEGRRGVLWDKVPTKTHHRVQSSFVGWGGVGGIGWTWITKGLATLSQDL